MSQTRSTIPIETIKAVYPPVDFQRPPKYVIEEASEKRLITRYPATAPSNSTVTFNPAINDNRTILDRQMLIQIGPRFTVNHGGANGAFQNAYGSTWSLRAFPIHNCWVDTMTVQANNASFTQPMSRYIEPMLRYQPADEKNRMMSLTPCMQDTAQQYGNFLGGANSPLLGAADDYPGGQLHRGGFPITFISDVGGVCIFDVLVSEWCMMSPFIFSKNNEPGLYGMQQLIVTLTMGSNLSRALSIDTANLGFAINSVAVDLTSNSLLQSPQLCVTTYTPKLSLPIPDSFVWSYYQISPYVTSLGTINAGQTVNVSSNNVQFNGIGKGVYIWARISDNARDFSTTDSYMSISSLDILFNDQTGYFSSDNEQTLYNICQKNGFNGSYQDWRAQNGNGCGSVFFLNFGHDIGLPSDKAAGTSGNYNFNIQNITLTNRSAANIPVDLFIVVVSEGLLTLERGAYTQEISVLDASNIQATKSSVNAINYQDYVQDNSYYGGARSFKSLFKDARGALKKGLRSVGKIAQSKSGQAVLRVAGDIGRALPYGEGVVDLIEKYGPDAYALAQDLIGKGLVGGCSCEEACMMASGLIGGGLVGGRRKKRLQY